MGRAAKSTRGGNKHRINPGRLAKKFAKQGMSERSAEVAARTAARLSKQTSLPVVENTGGAAASSSSTADNANANNQQQQPMSQRQQLTVKKNAIAQALSQLKQQRDIHGERTVVKQAQRRH